MGNDEKMLTMQELINQPEFNDALNTFYLIQKWGAKYRGEQRTGLKIREMLEGWNEWEELSAEEHKRIGFLIAHNFPNFAALCTIPVYVVFDRSDENDNGIYRMATYTKEKV